MRPAARRLLLGVTAALLAVSEMWAADSVARSAPTRPGGTAVATAPLTPVRSMAQAKSTAPKRGARRLDGISLKDAASRLGLKLSFEAGGRRAVLSDTTRRFELEVDSREAQVNGLRFFLGDPVFTRRGTLYVSTTDYRTCLVPLLRPSLIPARLSRPNVIALDPGHGGSDNGTQNPKLNLKEKVFTLDVARRLETLLERRGYTVVLTRKTDERVELAQRALIANRAKADLFVSIHFNSLFPDTKTSGAEVFTFTRAGQRSDSSRGLGQEDDTEEDPAPVNRHDAWSVALAQALHRRTVQALKLPDRGHKTKHLGMLRALNCPGALVESGFLSNETEARKIATPAYRQQIAEALAAGIDDYVRLVTAPATKR